MIDRLRDEIGIRAIGVVEKLDNKTILELCAGNIPEKLFNGIKASGINLGDPLEREILVQYAIFRVQDALMHNSVEFNGLYFEKEAPRNSNGNKILYLYKESKLRIKSVSPLGARHAYPSEAFSLIIAGLEGKLNFEQKAVADDMLKGYGEWLGAEIERKGDRLIVYLEDFANMEFDVKGIPSQQFVDLSRFPEDFVVKMYSRRFGDLPKKMREGNDRIQLYLPSDGMKWPLGRGSFVDYGVYGFSYNGASRWVVSRENFSTGNGGKK